MGVGHGGGCASFVRSTRCEDAEEQSKHMFHLR